MKIFTPIGGVYQPEYFDGVDNLLTKGVGLQTNSMSFATIAQTELLPNTFSNERNNARIQLDYVGQIIGGAGNKQFRVLIDAIVVGVSTSFNIADPGNFNLALTIAYRNSQIIAQMDFRAGPTGIGATVANLLGIPLTNFDPTMSHIVALQALVVNAADVVRCDWFGGSLR